MTVGQPVPKGEILARLDSSALGRELLQRRLAVQRARSGSASPQQSDTDRDKSVKELELELALLELHATEESLDEYTLRAPAAGEILSIGIQPGHPVRVVGESIPAFMVAVGHDAVVDIEMDEFDASLIAAGQKALIYVQSWWGNRPLSGVVSSDPALRRVRSAIGAPAAYSLTISIGGRPEGVRWGATARAEIEVGSRAGVLAVPLAAVLTLEEGDFVIAVNPDGRRRLTQVELGLSDNQLVEVTSGAAEGEAVLLGSAERLRAVAVGMLDQTGRE